MTNHYDLGEILRERYTNYKFGVSILETFGR